MIKVFRSFSIKNKLMAIILLTSGTVLLIASMAFFINEMIVFRTGLKQELLAMADIIGKNSAASLVFNDRKSATDTLEGLSVKPRVLGAFIVTNDYKLFASYISEEVHKKRLVLQRNGNISQDVRSCGMLCHAANMVRRSEDESSPPLKKAVISKIAEEANDFWGMEGGLEVMKPILIDGRVIGMVVIQSDTNEVFTKLEWFLAIVLVIMAGAFLIAFFISRRLQAIISGPILHLAGVMKHVSEDKNYALRATKVNDDEIGLLIDGFNEMLEQIRLRDEKLERHSGELEEKVALRTEELSKTNIKLERTVTELKQAKEAAESASRAKSQFLANMSHEIRTPMNGVLGMVELLLDSELNEKQKKFAETVHKSGGSLLRIINDILDFSKIEAGKMEMENIPFDLHKTISDAVVMFAESAQRKGLELVSIIDPAVPTHMEGDPGRLRQVIVNLVSNAVKFTEKGEIVVSVTNIEEDDDHSLIEVEVRDTGIGIEPGSIDRIFDCFSQADGSTTRQYGGTGLGLAIARQLIEMMGGGIRAESEPGKGSTFRFTVRFKKQPVEACCMHPANGTPQEMKTLPADDSNRGSSILKPRVEAWEMRSETAGSATGKPSCDSVDLSECRTAFNARILLAEDNPINQALGVEMLREFGCAADVAPNGRKAVEALSHFSYDLVFMDCQMPEMDGLRATRAIREKEAREGGHTTIVALTAHAMEGDREQCLEAGMDDYVSKPFTMEELRSVLARWIPEKNHNPPHQGLS